MAADSGPQLLAMTGSLGHCRHVPGRPPQQHRRSPATVGAAKLGARAAGVSSGPCRTATVSEAQVLKNSGVKF